jgi:tetratricopeptide (TPR) repeat protein
MPIADPHAIPETEHDCHEYLVEGDQAWDAGNTELASTLYHSLANSHFASATQSSHAYYRVGLIAMNDGDTDRALQSFGMSHEPGAADAVKSLTNATHDDPTPSPDVVPETLEQVFAWADAAAAATKAGDWELSLGLYTAVAGSTTASPGTIAVAEARAGIAAHHLGHDDIARQWMERALPNLADDEGDLTTVRKLLHDYGGAHVDAADDTPAAAQVAAGIQAYESGDAHAARTALEAALHLDGPDEQKGRARYYLGAMDYQAHKYADARVHIEAAVQTAVEPERSWAEAALHWRWDEDQTP